MEIKKIFIGLYCLRPFINLEILFNKTSCCCEGWMPNFKSGDLAQLSLYEIWNSEIMQKLRQSIFDGTYHFCSKTKCPYLVNEKVRFYLFTKDELKTVINANYDSTELELPLLSIKKFVPWIKNILDGKVILDILPASYNLCYDITCNLKCPSCRTNDIIYSNGEDFEQRNKIHKKLFKAIEENGYENIRNLCISGGGDPFASKIYRNFLINFEGYKYPLLTIFIMTNGLLLTPKMWEKMLKIHSNIESIFISIDAATPSTYKKLRVNSNFEKILKNIKFLGQKRIEKKLKYLMLAFVVQKQNYKEMVDIVNIAKEYNVDQVLFNALDNWNTWTFDEYFQNDVCNPGHPEHSDFLKILSDPIFENEIVNLGNIINYRT